MRVSVVFTFELLRLPDLLGLCARVRANKNLGSLTNIVDAEHSQQQQQQHASRNVEMTIVSRRHVDDGLPMLMWPTTTTTTTTAL